MTGEELYTLYCEKDLDLNNCSSDFWDDLDESTQNVWAAVATHLMEG